MGLCDKPVANPNLQMGGGGGGGGAGGGGGGGGGGGVSELMQDVFLDFCF